MEETLFRYRVSGGRFHISQGETLFRGRLHFVTPAPKRPMPKSDVPQKLYIYPPKYPTTYFESFTAKFLLFIKENFPMTFLAVSSYMLHYAQMIRFLQKVITHFEPRSVFSSYSCTLYDIIIFCNPLATLPTPKSGGTRLPTPRIDAFPQSLVYPNIDDKS